METAQTVKPCTTCKLRPRVDQRIAATNRQCTECRADYHRSYMDTKEQKAEAQGFARGVEALRAVLVCEFSRLGAGSFSGDEVAHLIAQTPRPKFSEDPKTA